MTPAEAIRNFIEGRLADWQGLPLLTVGGLSEILGAPVRHAEAPLGTATAPRYTFELRERDASLFAHEANAHIVLVEISPPPGLDALEGLPEPTAVLPQEIRIDRAYAHEYFYAERGLLLTIAKPFEAHVEDRLVRCRGIRPLPPTARTPGPDLYAPLATRIKW